VPRLLAVVAAALALAATIIPSPATGLVYASISASFRDLPASVRAGDILAVQVGVPNGSTCEGTITYRDGGRQKLEQRNEGSGRCRWDITVPTDTRRGTSDIDVTIRRDGEQTTITASIEVVSRGDDVDAGFNNLPESARRGDQVTIRVDVSDGSTCQGNVVYDDGRAQALDSQTERRQRCRWDITVLSDAPYGPAKIRVGIAEGTGQVALSGSFMVDREANDAHFQVGLKDLPATIRREDSFPIKALVPSGSQCTGTIAYYGASQPLDEQKETNGECNWSTQVPTSAKAGNAEIRVTAKQGDDQETAVAGILVERGSTDIGAAFRDLPSEIRRGQTLEIRVNVPNGSSCDGSLTYLDSSAQGLGGQTEHKDRCLWQIDVPNNAPRGMATVRVSVTESGDSTTLVGNVEVLGKNDVSSSTVTKASWGSNPPGSVKPGDTIDVRVNAPNDSSCVGKILYSDGMKWVLGKRDEDSSQCRWTATVPTSVGPGKATIEVSVTDSSGETKLSQDFDVKSTTLATTSR